MSRQRFIHPQIWRSPEFAKLEPEARLLFIGIITTADDHGRRRAESALLKADLFPLNPKMGEGRLEKLRTSVEKAGLIRVYGEGRYIDIPNWHKFQKPKYAKPSKIPEYSDPNPGQIGPEVAPKRPGTRSMGLGSGLGLGLGSGLGTTPVPPSSPSEPSTPAAPTSQPSGAVPVTPAEAKGTNNGRPLTDSDVPLSPVFKMLCRGSGVPLGVVACEIANGRELAWVLAWLMVTEGDVLKGKQTKGGEIKSPGAWFRALCSSGKAPPDKYLADAKRKLSEQGEKSLPTEVKGMLDEIACAYAVAHKKQCPKCRCYYWTDEEHICPQPVAAGAPEGESQEAGT